MEWSALEGGRKHVGFEDGKQIMESAHLEYIQRLPVLYLLLLFDDLLLEEARLRSVAKSCGGPLSGLANGHRTISNGVRQPIKEVAGRRDCSHDEEMLWPASGGEWGRRVVKSRLWPGG